MRSLLDLLAFITIKDIIDISIVTLLLYQILYIVKGTRAVQMFIGLLSLALLNWIGNYFKLYSLSWILDHFFNSFFILLVIIFQDELRSALANFWTKGEFLGGNKKDYFSDIEEIILATRKFSQQKIGALIVFERLNGLSNFVSTGTKLNSEVHTDLLYSLFYPKSPLHDGAVIIDKGRVEAAGCFLPLSQNGNVDKQFGTRHRAGLGVSEISDAVVVIVSEETGNIGVCLEGRYHHAQSSEQLRKWLIFLLQRSSSHMQSISEFDL